MFTEPPPAAPTGDPDDEWDAIIEELTKTQRQLKKLGPKTMGTAAGTLTFFSALFAWFLTPPVGRIATLLSLGAGGAAGGQLADRLKKQRRATLPAVVAELIKESGIRELKPSQVEELGQRYGFEPNELEGELKVLYERYLARVVEEEGSQPSEVSTLAALRRGLGLRWNTTAQIHVATGEQLTKGSPLPTEEDEERQKLLWLSLSLFATSKGKGKAAAEDLYAALGLDEAAGQRVVNELSTPIYKKAVAQAVGKYNRTETPEVIGKVRRALCMSDGAAQAVHSAMYDAQLRLLLPDDDSAKLTDESTQILGELEGILQIRSAVRLLQARTVPLYRRAARATLEEALASDTLAAPAVWGGLALRQQQLSLPTEVARAALVEEARQVASQQLNDAAELFAAGSQEDALQNVQQLSRYGDFVGKMLEVSGWDGGASATDLAEQYLGALSLSPALEAIAPQLLYSAVASDTPPELLKAMLALTEPALASAKSSFNKALDDFLQSSAPPAGAGAELTKLAVELGLPPAVQQKLALAAYYGWLLDLSETVDQSALERCELIRGDLGIQDSSVGELYSNTDIDELVLNACAEQLFSNDRPFSPDDQQWLLMLERLLLARPGVINSVLQG